MNVTLAVIPGFSRRSPLSTSMTASYVTTFWSVVALSRTCRTTPANERVGYASTVNVTLIPGRIFPTSASATFVSTCIRVRSCAIVKSVGACSVAATV